MALNIVVPSEELVMRKFCSRAQAYATRSRNECSSVVRVHGRDGKVQRPHHTARNAPTEFAMFGFAAVVAMARCVGLLVVATGGCQVSMHSRCELGRRCDLEPTAMNSGAATQTQ